MLSIIECPFHDSSINFSLLILKTLLHIQRLNLRMVHRGLWVLHVFRQQSVFLKFMCISLWALFFYICLCINTKFSKLFSRKYFHTQCWHSVRFWKNTNMFCRNIWEQCSVWKPNSSNLNFVFIIHLNYFTSCLSVQLISICNILRCHVWICNTILSWCKNKKKSCHLLPCGEK